MKRNVRARTGQEVQPWADSERGGGSEKVPLRSQSVGACGYMNVHVDLDVPCLQRMGMDGGRTTL